MGIKHIAVKSPSDRGTAAEWNDNHHIDGDVDFEQHEIIQPVIENLAAAPVAPVEAQMYYNTVDKKLYIWNGTSWDDVTSETREFFVPIVTYDDTQQRVGYHSVMLISSPNSGYIDFHAPHDFTSIVEAVVVGISENNVALANLDLYSQYGAVTEAYNTHAEQDLASTYPLTANDIFELDISGILTALAAGDYVGIRIKNSAFWNIYVIGIRFRYI